MQAMVFSRAARGGAQGRRARWVAAALAAAALSPLGGMPATAAPAAPSEGDTASPSVAVRSCPSASCRRIATGTGEPVSAAEDSTGKTLYVFDRSGSGSLWRVDTATRTKDPDPVATGLGHADIALADDRTAYLADYNDDHLWRVNLETGEKTKVADLLNPNGLALDGQGHAYVATAQANKTVYKVNLTTGEKEEVVVAPGSLSGMALDGNGGAYTFDFDHHVIYRVDLRTGDLTTVARNLPAGSGALALDGAGNLYTADRDNGILNRIRLSDGTVTKAATGLGRPADVRLRRDGSALVSDPDSGTIWHVTHLRSDNGQTPPGNTKVELHPVTHITAVPGRSAVPRVNVTNTGAHHIGNQDITLKLGPEGVKWGFNVVYQDRDGRTVETPCHTMADQPGTSLCKNVPLNLDPGQSLELRTEVNTSKALKPCDLPSITWTIAGTSTKTDWVMKNEDGSPTRC
ncbi:Vgb family protein [Streptomyces sp. NPDC003016]